MKMLCYGGPADGMIVEIHESADRWVYPVREGRAVYVPQKFGAWWPVENVHPNSPHLIDGTEMTIYGRRAWMERRVLIFADSLTLVREFEAKLNFVLWLAGAYRHV